MIRPTLRVVATALWTLGSAASSGCADANEDSPATSDCEGDKCDDASDGTATCRELLNDRSGNGLSPEAIAGNNDAFARNILAAQGPCATSVTDMVPLLKAAGCDGGLRTAFVSERSARLDTFVDYRAVTRLPCNIDDEVFLHFPLSADELAATPMPAYLASSFPAIIARDPATGIVNFYQSTGDHILFFGNSLDMLKGTDLARLDAEVTSAENFTRAFEVDRSCAACHPGGGLVMKELDFPWLHWEGEFTSPQTEALVSAAPDLLGFLGDGEDMEDGVFNANETINDVRLATIRAGIGQSFDLRDLLRPLFCTTDFNIQSGTSERPSRFGFDGAVVVGISTGLRFNTPENAYAQILEQRGSHLATDPPFLETMGGLTFISDATMDRTFISRLQQGSDAIMDLEFINDVRLVDFTRGIYSEERCSLLEFAKDIPAQVIHQGPAAMTQAFITALEQAGRELLPAEQDFLANLREANSDEQAFADQFAQACQDRLTNEGPEALIGDYVAYVAEVRKRAADPEAGRAHGDATFMQFRFPGVAGFAMPIDDQPRQPGLRFDPNTCQLTTAYVALRGDSGAAAL